MHVYATRYGWEFAVQNYIFYTRGDGIGGTNGHNQVHMYYIEALTPKLLDGCTYTHLHPVWYEHILHIVSDAYLWLVTCVWWTACIAHILNHACMHAANSLHTANCTEATSITNTGIIWQSLLIRGVPLYLHTAYILYNRLHVQVLSRQQKYTFSYSNFLSSFVH